MSVELKPCPFCGGTDIASHGDDKVVGFHCNTCHAVGPTHYGKRDWNTRPTTDAELETAKGVHTTHTPVNAELEKWKFYSPVTGSAKMIQSANGEYVRYDQANAVIADRDAENERLSVQCHELNEELQDAYDRNTSLEAKVKGLEAALQASNDEKATALKTLKVIAQQKLIDELDEDEAENAAIEDAYNMIVSEARAALSATAEK